MNEHEIIIKEGRRAIEQLELMILEDIEREKKNKDLGWDTETLIEEFLPIIKKMDEDSK